MLRPPRFPFAITLLAWLLLCGLYPVTSWTMARAHELWPAAIFLAYIGAFVGAFAFAAMAIDRWCEARKLLRFHTRRLNPVVFHIPD